MTSAEAVRHSRSPLVFALFYAVVLTDKEAEIDRLMLEQSSVRIVAADNSKFNRCAFAKISGLSVVDYIATDTSVPDALENKITKHSIKIC